MSFFNRGGQPQPPSQPGGYSRLPPPRRAESPYDAGPRSYDRRAPVPSTRGGGGGEVFEVTGVPSDLLALTNCIIVHPNAMSQGQHILVVGDHGSFPATVRHDNTGKLDARQVALSAPQRQTMQLSAGDRPALQPLSAPPYLQSLDLEVGFLKRGVQSSDQFSADEMARHVVKTLSGTLFSNNATLAFEFRGYNLKALVKSLSVVELAEGQRGAAAVDASHYGILMEKTDVTIMKAADSGINLKGSSKKAPPNAILAPNFKFEDMGIGGLDSEFSGIFRRAFASRVFPPGLVEKLGIQHVKGILLYGTPGTGKTLMARQIGKMLNAREPKIVNGPEILSKYVGASEENIRKLFADAEAEYKSKGDESGLHIIIFDELDAICKQRGTTSGGTGVGDTVVNQLLSKMDGVDQLNNILIIGMTNRKDMIDEALLRPGRLEVHMEISLPDERGRLQILSIHTAKMRANNVMGEDVDIAELAQCTKNFSGAEIAGLVKSATSFAFNRHVKVGTMAAISDDVSDLKVYREDFMHALDEVHPAFGVSEEELQAVVENGIIHYDPVVDDLLRDGQLFVEQVRTSTRTPLVSVLLHGPPGSGKTALAATIAQASQFPFVKLLSPEGMVGLSEGAKIAAINKVFSDSYKSPLSVVVVDNIERLLEWTPIGSRFSNAILQALLVLMAKRPPKGRRLLIIATTSIRPLLTELQMSDVFDAELRVPPITALRALEHVVHEMKLFPSRDDRKQAMAMLEQAGFKQDGKLNIGIKKLMSVIEMARQEPDATGERLTSALMGLA